MTGPGPEVKFLLVTSSADTLPFPGRGSCNHSSPKRHATQGMEHVMGIGAVTISSGIAFKQMGGGDTFTRMAVIRLKNTEEL
ncbi:MAG TPA: hypothetical protein VMW20_10630 [Candidatus Nanoarchaeia archaeon]|nr:hypothetical protein [Candidatus Nanoarchaeia archaeon]